MADPEELSLAESVRSDNGDIEEHGDAPEVVGDDDNAAGYFGTQEEYIDNSLVDDLPASAAIGNGAVSNRYREILQQQRQDSSDVSSLGGSSVHGLPKRAGSPIDSVLSGPDDTPSIQVTSLSS